MTRWIVIAGLAPIAAAAMVRVLVAVHRRAQARRQVVDDLAWQDAYARHGGAVVKFAGYDQTKAVEGHQRAQRRTATGQILRTARQLQVRARRTPSRPGVVPMDARRRAGGDR